MNLSLKMLFTLGGMVTCLVACGDSSVSVPPESPSSSSEGASSSSSRPTTEIPQGAQDLLDSTQKYEWKLGVMSSDMVIGRKVQVHFSSCVAVNKKLTIKEGAELFFDENACLMVSNGGQLVVEGTEQDSVYFVPAQNGKYWGNGSIYGGISFSPNAATGSLLQYAVVDSAANALVVERENGLTLKNSSIRNSQNSGLILKANHVLQENGLQLVHFSHNEVAHIQTAYPSNLLVIDNSSTFEDSVGTVLLEGGVFDQTGELPAFTVSYSVTKPLKVTHATSAIALTLPAGVSMRFHESAYIGVEKNANLFIKGRKDAPVRMNSLEPGKFWGKETVVSNAGGIRITPNALAENVLEYLELDSADNGILGYRENGLILKNSKISHAKNYGLYLRAKAALSENGLVDNTFSNNGLHHIWSEINSIVDVGVNSFEGDDLGILLATGELEKTATLKNLGVPYFVNGKVMVSHATKDITLTIEPGVRMLLKPSSYLFINSHASLIAEGTAQDSIYLGPATAGTGWGDGSGSGSDSYSGISIKSGVNSIAYMALDGAWTGISVADATLDIQNSSIRNCKNYGLYLFNTGTITDSDMNYSGNGKGNINKK